MSNAFLLRLNTRSLFLNYYLVLFRLMIASLTQAVLFCFFWGGSGIIINKNVKIALEAQCEEPLLKNAAFRWLR